MPNKDEPWQSRVCGCERTPNFRQEWLSDVEIDRLVMQIFKDQRREAGKIGLRSDNFTASFQLAGSFIQKVDWIFEVMENIGQRDYVQTFIPDRIESIDRMAIEDIVKII